MFIRSFLQIKRINIYYDQKLFLLFYSRNTKIIHNGLKCLEKWSIGKGKKNKQMGKYIKEIHLPKKTDTKEYFLVIREKN